MVTEQRLVPKRSLLAQERSRDTRRAIVKSALELWAERGYDNGVEETTAEEIAARAGVSKATFYLHFARKEDILLHTGWITARVVHEDALAELAAGRDVDEALDRLMARLGRRVQKVPRGALRRILQAQMSDLREHSVDEEPFGLGQAFLTVIVPAQEAGHLPGTVTSRALAKMLASLTMDAICDWAIYGGDRLPDVMRQRAALLLAGARNMPAG
jgi:AcrR family transcriptional regulator